METFRILKTSDPAYIQGLLEPDAGAHYYIHAPESSLWNAASCRIRPAECRVRGIEGTRRAFLCLGLYSPGTKRQFDFGLANSGPGWYPMSWCPGGFETRRENVLVHASDRPFLLPEDTEITLSLTFRREDAADIVRGEVLMEGKPAAFAETRAPAGALLGTGGPPRASFIRFISLCPLSGPSTPDGSALSARLRDLRLGMSAWDDGRVAHAWAVCPKNMPVCRLSRLTGAARGEDEVVIENTGHTRSTKA